MSDDLIERLRYGCVYRPRRWSGDTHTDLGGTINEDATDAVMAEAADEIERLEEAARRLDVLLGVCSNAVRSGIDSWCGVHRCFVPDDLPQGQRVCEVRWVLGQIAGSGTDR